MLLLFLVLTSVVAIDDVYSIVAIHSRVTHPVKFKQALQRAYDHHIKNTKHIHMVSVWLDDTVLLTWTDAKKHAEDILYAIEHVELTTISVSDVHDCTVEYDFAAVLHAIATSPDNVNKLTNVYYVVDNAQDTATYTEAVTAATVLVKEHNVKIYPLGIGPCVQSSDLKRIAGPCHPLFGCHPPFAYYQSTEYSGVQRATQEVRAARLAQKHAITTAEGLTTAQLAVTIILCIIVGAMTLGCLVYSCCYMPQQVHQYNNRVFKKTDGDQQHNQSFRGRGGNAFV